MTFAELQKEIGEYIYSEDDGMTRVALASVIATRLQVSDPIWLILIGPSSSGKSQVLRPIALTDEKFIHRVDDLTENTLMSGAKVKDGQTQNSLLKRIGKLGIIVVSDLTVLFSKSTDTRTTILSQFRMMYDGEMVKYTGNRSAPIKWKGSIGVLAGSTPSIYSSFEEVADMGERFIYYRMRDYNIEKATRLALSRKLYGSALDDKIATVYGEYIKEVVMASADKEIPALSEEMNDRMIFIAMFASKLRTPTHYDKYQKTIDKIPVPEMPPRIAIQLTAIAKGLMCMSENMELTDEDMGYIEWCAYSLANEERRACLKVIAGVSFEDSVSSQAIADSIGLSTSIISMNLQHLSAVGVLERYATSGSLMWRFKRKHEWEIIRRLEKIKDDSEYRERELSTEETGEMEDVISELFRG